jgi:outer membrane protein assembly factor BamD (BamD/ComL family)
MKALIPMTRSQAEPGVSRPFAVGRVVCVIVLLVVAVARAQEPVPANVDEFSKAVFFGQKFFQLKDYGTAYQQFAKADSFRPDHPGVLYNMAMLLAKTGRYSEAQVKVDRYLQLYPNGAERPVVTQLQLEIEFQRELQKKRQTDQEYSDLFTRGQFLYLKNDLDGALKLFQDAEQRRPNDRAAVYDQGVLYERMGDFGKASERFHRYLELETEPELKSAIEQRILALENEISEMKTKIVCSFCGFRLPIGATWCPRCWHGPYLTSSAVWNTRPCLEGASATRATFFMNDRFNNNEVLPCLWNGTMLEVLRYTPAKQKSIQDARKSEGWIYSGEIIHGWRDKQGNEIRYVQGPDRLERIDSPSGGEILTYSAHKAGEIWLLDREETLIDGQKYTSHYTFDANNRIAQQQVEYQNTSGCNHAISMSADYSYQNEALVGVRIKGAYDGYVTEGSPHTEWQASIVNTFDTAGRVTKEDLVVSSFTKTYTRKPYGAARAEVASLYPGMRVNRPIQDLARIGDLCGASGNIHLGNPIDLRPFYAVSPDLAIQLGYGVTRATVTLSYPDSFKLY